jgi:NDP-sugar pyrophosphorylase family protein
MSKKYKLTKTTKQVNGKTLYQIKALTSFSDVKKGDLGGWIEKEYNLSHEGNCWVYNNACVYDSARVSGNALVFGNVLIYGNARVCDRAQICNDARVYGDAFIFDSARVYGNARVYEGAWVFGNARVSDNARVYRYARVCGNAWVSGDAGVCGNVVVSEQIKLVSGYFFHTKTKIDKIKIVNTCGSDYETLSYEPRIEEIKEVGEKVKVRLAEGTIVEGEIVE